MNIAIDVSRLSSLNRTRGIGTYALQLTQALTKVDKKNKYILATSRHDRLTADITHFPTFEFFSLNLPLTKENHWVVTIHDVIPLVFPRHFPPGIRGQIKFFIQKHNLSRADAIITDSHASKKDIVRYLRIPLQKIHVIHLGVSQQFKPITSATKINRLKKTYKLTHPYLLYVGDVNYNKNVFGLLEAFSLLNLTDLDLVLVSSAWKRKIPQVIELNKLIKELGLQSKVKKISLNSSKLTHLIHLYNLAQVYVQPSLYEGFGLPVLEAMACGVPVVSTNVASLPEICGTAAVMVKPQASDIAAGINQVLNMNPRQRQSLIRAGLSQAAKFTWAKTARETIKVYNQVLRG